MRNSASPTCRAAGTTRHDCPGQERVAYLSARFLESRNAAASCAAWSGRRPSKRNLVVHFAALAGAGHGRLLLACRGAGGTEIGAIIRAGLAAALAGPVEHGELGVEVLQHHFGRVLVLAGLVLPFAGLQLALEIDLRALLQILLGDPASPSLKITTRCHSVLSRRSPVALSRQLSEVATLKFAIGRPSWVRLISGSLPRLPTRITLLTEPAMIFSCSIAQMPSSQEP